MQKRYLLFFILLLTLAAPAQGQILETILKGIQKPNDPKNIEAAAKMADDWLARRKAKKSEKVVSETKKTGVATSQNASERVSTVYIPSTDQSGNASVAGEWLRKAEAEPDGYKKIDDCNQALKADPSTIETYYFRGIYLADVADYEKAAADFDKFLEYRPDHAEALNGRGYCRQQLGRHTEAIRDFGLSIASNNEHLDYVFNNRGWSYALQEDYEKAIRDFDQAVKLNPALVEAQFRKGWCLQQVGQHADAVKAFDLAINQQTDYTQAWYLRGVSKSAQGYDKEAILDYNKVLSQDPSNQDVLLARAYSRIALEKYSEAIDDCSTLIRLNPDNAEAYNTRGYCLLQKTQYSNALPDFTKSLSLKYDSPHLVYTNRGQTYIKLGLYDEARADFIQALQLKPNHPDAVTGKQLAERLKNPNAGAGVAVSRSPNLLNRYALVIGNSGYSYTTPLSQNPLNDARDMDKKLRELGFKVTLLTNATKRQMEDAVQAMTISARKADVVTVFYAGHGLENAGVNYLIPIDAKIDSLRYVQQEAISLDDVLTQLRRCEAKVSLVFLDACRNNPFRSWAVKRGDNPADEAKRGAFVDPPGLEPNEVVYYATRPKNVAGNGSGRNGDMTTALLQYLRRGVELKEMWQEVSQSVYENTRHIQVPYFAGILLTDFVF
jgi:tetratricopeptide (TPR) repeat protein